MKINDEFIGRTAEIVRSRNKQLVGLKGKIVDETKNSFKFVVNERIKMILKKDIIFSVEGVVFDGNLLLKRPEDRIKLKK